MRDSRPASFTCSRPPRSHRASTSAFTPGLDLGVHTGPRPRRDLGVHKVSSSPGASVCTGDDSGDDSPTSGAAAATGSSLVSSVGRLRQAHGHCEVGIKRGETAARRGGTTTGAYARCARARSACDGLHAHLWRQTGHELREESHVSRHERWKMCWTDAVHGICSVVSTEPSSSRQIGLPSGVCGGSGRIHTHTPPAHPRHTPTHRRPLAAGRWRAHALGHSPVVLGIECEARDGRWREILDGLR